MTSTVTGFANGNLAVEARNMHVYYGPFRAVKDVSLKIKTHAITAFIGPSGCGKSTVLRSFNRMNDLVATARVEGEILYHGNNIYSTDVDPVEIRRRIGMVFKNPTRSPKRFTKTSPGGAN